MRDLRCPVCKYKMVAAPQPYRESTVNMLLLENERLRKDLSFRARWVWISIPIYVVLSLILLLLSVR